MKESTSKIRTIMYVALFLLAGGIATFKLWQYYQQQPPLPDLGIVSDFSLMTADRKAFTHQDFIGKVTITDFIFTTCAGPCPIMSGQMQQLQATLHENSSIQFVSFSVDPEYDTPEILTEYATRYGAIKDKWIFLTGEKKTIYDITKNSFHLSVEDDENAVLHSTKFVLVDQEARIRGYYDSEDEESLKKLIEDTKSLL